MKTFSGDQAGFHIRQLLDNAKESLRIISPYIGKYYADLLVTLSQRGVDVSIITSKNDLNIESIGILKANENSHLHPLVIDEKTSYIHSKIYLADKEHGISGSANLTYRGLNTNVESLNIAETREDLLQIENDFLEIWRKYAKEGLSKEDLSNNTSHPIRNALPLPNDYLGFIEQPHIETKELVYYPYFFFEYSFRGSVISTPLVFEEHDFLVIDGIDNQIINNGNPLIEEINNKTAKDYIVRTDNKFSLEMRQPTNLNLREAHELALDYVIKKNTKKYKKFKDKKGTIRYYVPESKGIAFIKENTQFYGQKAESRVYVPERNNISFIKEHFVQVPIWYLVTNEQDGLKHQKAVLASSGREWRDLIFCPICNNKISMHDTVSCTVCNKTLCQKCTRETGLILKKKYCPSCYQNLASR